MRKSDWIAAMMAASEGDPWTPVQIQKSLFLLDREVEEVGEAKLFHFKAYHYGPFDGAIYELLEQFEEKGWVNRFFTPPPRRYSLTRAGQRHGRLILKKLDEDIRQYIEEVSDYVHELSFRDLVQAIYREYPEMKENSVFAD